CALAGLAVAGRHAALARGRVAAHRVVVLAAGALGAGARAGHAARVLAVEPRVRDQAERDQRAVALLNRGDDLLIVDGHRRIDLVLAAAAPHLAVALADAVAVVARDLEVEEASALQHELPVVAEVDRLHERDVLELTDRGLAPRNRDVVRRAGL